MIPDIDRKISVLIVDDDENNLQITAKVVHSAGYQVILARDGMSALEFTESVIPDAVLLDIMMPGIDGLEVCRIMKNNPALSDTPIIFLSAVGEEEKIETGLDYGGADFVSKPVSNRVLLARLRSHIERGILHKHLNEKNHELKQVVQKLHLLSGITRHDILNKITALNGYVALIREQIPESEPMEYIDRTKDIIGVITKQITFTRDYQEIGIHSPEWQNINEIIKRATGSLDIQSVLVEYNQEGLEIFADPLLERIFYNLFENSLRHGIDLTSIHLFMENQGENLMIVYEDDGGGVPDAEKENIFIRKYYKNSGFGLFLSREILEITGFLIQEKGEVGIGVRFEITIPNGYFRYLSN